MNHTLSLSQLKTHLMGFKYLIVDQSILDLYPQLFLQQAIFSFMALEKNKTQQSITQLHEFLFTHQIKRHEQVLIMGGGITLDMAGFAVATYMRGISFTSVPTTLLAMVDVCHGGKVGINTSHGKNTIGTFYSPKNVLLCSEFLNTLPWIETQNGISEMLKHLIISGKHHFPEPHLLTQQDAILQSIKIKETITAQDPHDLGIRQCLNLGPTLAHAAEITSHYALSHGQAVAWGLLIEGHILEAENLIHPYTHTLKKYFNAHFQLPSIPALPMLWQAMQFDKKNTHSVCISHVTGADVFPTTYGMWKNALKKAQSCR